MTWNGFGSINLTGVAADGEGMNLRPGSYTCRVSKAEVKDSKDGRGKVLHLSFNEVDGRGSIMDFVNIYHQKQDVREIGARRLANFMRSTNHPNPDNPGDIKSLIGLTVGVHVDPKEYVNKAGDKKMGSGVRERGAYFSPDGKVEAPQASGGSRSSAPIDDEIPF